MRFGLLTTVTSFSRLLLLEFVVSKVSKNKIKRKTRGKVRNVIMSIWLERDDRRAKFYVKRLINRTAHGEGEELHVHQANVKRKDRFL